MVVVSFTQSGEVGHGDGCDFSEQGDLDSSHWVVVVFQIHPARFGHFPLLVIWQLVGQFQHLSPLIAGVDLCSRYETTYGHEGSHTQHKAVHAETERTGSNLTQSNCFLAIKICESRQKKSILGKFEGLENRNEPFC